MPKLNRKKLILLLILIVATIFWWPASLSPAHAGNLLFVADFESESLAGELVKCTDSTMGSGGEDACPTVISSDDSVKARAGNYMMRTWINPKISANPYRSEVEIRLSIYDC